MCLAKPNQEAPRGPKNLQELVRWTPWDPPGPQIGLKSTENQSKMRYFRLSGCWIDFRAIGLPKWNKKSINNMQNRFKNQSKNVSTCGASWDTCLLLIIDF